LDVDYEENLEFSKNLDIINIMRCEKHLRIARYKMYLKYLKTGGRNAKKEFKKNM